MKPPRPLPLASLFREMSPCSSCGIPSQGLSQTHFWTVHPPISTFLWKPHGCPPYQGWVLEVKTMRVPNPETRLWATPSMVPRERETCLIPRRGGSCSVVGVATELSKLL